MNSVTLSVQHINGTVITTGFDSLILAERAQRRALADSLVKAATIS